MIFILFDRNVLAFSACTLLRACDRCRPLLAKGAARVIVSAPELKDFKKGEILVIDSIDPTMTFFAPLAAGIIERRGGMLIHGAIIAREYGIPCITGVVDATEYIRSGDLVTVDAYLGICTVQRQG